MVNEEGEEKWFGLVVFHINSSLLNRKTRHAISYNNKIK